MSTRTESTDALKRVDYIDMTKGIGMLAIVWGHIMLSGWSNNLVYSFHIPLFFFLSGMMFNGNKYPSVGGFLKRRVKTLLVPYLMFSFVTWALWAVMNLITHSHVNFFRPLLQTIIAQGSGGFMVHNVPLWFVTCLFVVEALYYFINKLPSWLNILVCVLCALIGDYMIRGGHLSFFRLLPWNIECAMSALLFYSLGNLLMKKTTHQAILGAVASHKLLVTLAVAAVTAPLFFSANWNGHVTLGSNSLGRNTLLFYLNAFMGVFTTIAFSIILTGLTEGSMPGRYLKWFGRNSFYVMASHVPVKGVVILAVAKVFHSTPAGVSNLLSLSFLAFVITLVIDSVLVFLIAKLKEHDERIAQTRRARAVKI